MSSYRPVAKGLVDSLVEYAIAIDDVTPLEEERDAIFLKMKNGDDGRTLISSSINGKYFGAEVTMSLEEKFVAFVQAIKIFKGDAVVRTYPNFSGLIR